MMRFTCPSCGVGMSAPEEFAGRRTRCRQCNIPIIVPQPVTTSLPSDEAPENEFLQRETEPAEPEEQESEDQESLRSDREPWFYGYLEKYAKILQILGYIIAAGCAVLASIWFIVGLVGAFSTLKVSGGFGVLMAFLSFPGWVLGSVGIAAALLLWLVGVASMLLAVDAARNLRAMKKATATPK